MEELEVPLPMVKLYGPESLGGRCPRAVHFVLHSILTLYPV